MIKLLWGSTVIKKIDLKNIFLNVNRPEKDSLFNYQFIIDAFSGSKPSTNSIKDTTPLKISLDRLLLDHVTLRFKDKNGGTDFFAGIKYLDVNLNKFQPDRVNFGINDLAASDVYFFMRTYKEKIIKPYLPVPDDKVREPGYGLNITAANFNIRDAHVTIENTISGMYYTNKVTHLGLGNALLNLSESIATADELLLDSTFVQFINPIKTAGKDSKQLVTDVTPMPWQIKAKQVSLNHDHIRFDDNNLPRAEGLDFGHFNVKDIGADISSFIYSGNSTEALVKQLTFKDTSGFVLDTTHVNFLMTDSIISAREFYVKTPQTLLQNFIEIKYDSLAGITTNPRNSLLLQCSKIQPLHSMTCTFWFRH